MDLERFISLWARFGADGDWAGALYQDVYTLYATPGRHYHTPAHIAHCLQRKDEIAHLLEDPNTVELAIWFHDVIYDMGASDNEARSAEFFVERTAGKLSSCQAQRVVSHIHATIYPSQPTDPDAQFVVDIDLSSFSLPWPQFLRDSVNVRRESTTSDPYEYAEKQQSFLEMLCTAQPFFRTDFYLERYEQQAQDNIRRILALLIARQQFHRK